jgi:hypothetical protein
VIRLFVHVAVSLLLAWGIASLRDAIGIPFPRTMGLAVLIGAACAYIDLLLTRKTRATAAAQAALAPALDKSRPAAKAVRPLVAQQLREGD